MVVEINLLKTKHGVLARYEKDGNVEVSGALHKKRTFSILLIIVLLGVFAGLQYGERVFTPIQEPLIKALDYTLEMVPKLINELKGENDEEESNEDIVNVEDFFEVVDEGMKKSSPTKQAPPTPVVAAEKKITPKPIKKETPMKVAAKKEVQPTVQPPKKATQTAPVKKVAKPPAVAKKQTYVNVGSYLLKGNITKLREAGEKRGFAVKVKTVYRMLPNFALFVGNLKDTDQVTIVERDLNKRSIPFTITDKGNGSFDVYTKFTPLSFLAKGQESKLHEAGYVVKLIKKRKKTPLNQIFVGPLAAEDISGVVSYLKKSGFPTQVVKH